MKFFAHSAETLLPARTRARETGQDIYVLNDNHTFGVWLSDTAPADVARLRFTVKPDGEIVNA